MEKKCVPQHERKFAFPKKQSTKYKKKKNLSRHHMCMMKYE
jgi:hypothetical protein